ncbi:MAG TPA: ethanolamine ammonia-lyase subunit EutC [Nakamurella sp.]
MTEPVESTGSPDFWTGLRATTPSRIGLTRTGDAVTTRHLLEFRAAHAAARDAVHEQLDVAALSSAVTEVGLGEPVIVTSRAAGRGEYLRRPDLGRRPQDLGPLDAIPHGRDIAIVLADGLSPRALAEHGAPLLRALVDEFAGRWTLSLPVIATQARVALGDHIGAALGVGTLIVVIGERPGLSVADSLGIYLTQAPRVGLADADRNCVSNIHPPGGLGYREAARVTAGLVEGARALGRSGVTLKDTSRAVEPGDRSALD